MIYRFGDCMRDVRRALQTRHGAAVAIGPQVWWSVERSCRGGDWALPWDRRHWWPTILPQGARTDAELLAPGRSEAGGELA